MSEATTTEIFDIFEATPVHKGQDEWRFICPVCPDKRGKPDKDGKLYWNVLKNCGYCFKCKTSFFPESVDGNGFHLTKDELEYQKSVKILLSHFQDKTDIVELPCEVQFNFPDLTPDLLLYLKRRNPFLIPLKDWLGIKAWRGQDTGVVLPFFYGETICKFQCRFVTKKGKPLSKNDGMKYYTSPGPKPLYSPFHIFIENRTVNDQDEITLCEGVFDAIALAIMGFPNPLAVLGDKLTPLHVHNIRNLHPIITKINLCLDDEERNIDIEKTIRRDLLAVERIERFSFWLPYFKDPEEFLRGQIKIDKEFRSECSEMVSEWLIAVTT
jgi:hypothetical protein